MADTTLYNSTICRLCGENNINGEFLYTFENEESDLSSMINRYLPIKVSYVFYIYFKINSQESRANLTLLRLGKKFSL